MKKYLLNCGLLFCLLSASSHTLSQAQIRSSDPATPTPVAPTTSANDTTAALVYDLQALQQEVLQLRGLIEQQAHEIKRLKQQRLDDYLDLDKRLTELTTQPAPATAPQVTDGGPTTNSALPAPVVSPSTVRPSTASPSTGASPPIGTISPATSPIAAVNDQAGKELYSGAIDLLLNKQDYQGAQAKFEAYLTQYPQGQYTPNVYYWQGQIIFAAGKKDEAANMFKQLINDYPNHAKVPDAKFKLAKIYFEQGKKDEAKKIMEEVAASDSDAALLAKSFLSKTFQ